MPTRLALVTFLLALMLLTACGGGGSTSSTPSPTPTPTATTAPITVNMGDTGSERIVSFHQDITAVKLKTSSTDTAGEDGVAGTRHVEFTHLSGTFQPVEVHKSVSSDKTYTEAEVRFANTKITCLDNSGLEHVITKPDDKFTVPLSNIKLTPNATTTTILNFDVDVANSISADDTCTNVTLTPKMTLRSSHQIPQTEAEQKDDAEMGELEHIAGKITAVTASTFTIAVGQSGLNMTFAFDTTTKLDDGLTAITSAQVGAVVKVEGISKPDGSLFAKEVELASAAADALEAEGIVLKTGIGALVSAQCPALATCFKATLEDGVGSGVSANLGQVGTVIVDNTTSMGISKSPNITVSNGGTTLGALTFHLFSDLGVGQHVEVDNDSGIPATNTALTAKKVKLVQQAISGTVSATSPALQLTVTGTQFALLTGQTKVNVDTSQNPSGLALATLNANIRVRGFLFFSPNPSGVNYTLVATRIKSLP